MTLRRTPLASLALLLILGLGSCSEPLMLDPEQFTAAIAPVSWPDTLVAGERHGIQARITVNGQPVAGAAVRWSVADPSVLQVDTTTSADSIDVRGLRPGTSRVTASIADPALTQQSVSADVTVRLAGVRIVAPVDDTTLTALGDTLVVAAEGLGQSDVAVDGAGVTFTVEGTALRRISAALDRVEVVAAGTGTGRVIATHSLCSGACVDTVSVTVIQVPASVDVSGAVDSLAAGDTTTFSATVRDANGAAIPGPAVTWSSSDTAVAVVSAAGVVTGAAPGNATITAAAGSATGTRDITVTTLVVADAAVAPDSLRFASLQDTARLAATAYNGQGNVIPGVTFAWSSADTTVATVDAGGLVRSVGNGTTVVIAAGPGDAGGVADSATVVVDQVVASVTLTPASVTLHSKVDSVQLAAVAKDARGNDVASATVEYSRLHSTVTVNSSGLVISQAVGADTVVASVNGMADSTAITVEQVVKTLTVSPHELSLPVRGTATLTTSAQDTNGYAISAPDVTWTSLGPDMATVDASGLVTAVDGGTATLKVESAGAMDSSVVSVREYALDFDGTGAYGVAATGLDLGMDSTWTVELWVRRDSAAGDQYLLDRSDAVGASNFQYALLLHDGAPAFAARTGGGPGDWYQATAPDTLPIGTWHHLAATYDSATAALTLYVDGAAVTPTLTNPGKFGRMRAGKGSAVYLGAYGTSAGDGNFQGALDEVRIWSVARTGSQTANDYLKRLAGTQPGLAAYWPLDVGAGTAATDLTGAHPATLNGTTWTIDAPDLHY